jgi:hypothetical protein
MAGTLADNLVAAVLQSMNGYLRPLGFTKSGSTFRRETEESLQFVNLQRSKSSTKDKAIVTVNIGFELKGMRVWLRRKRQAAGVWDAGWNERIGKYMWRVWR